MLGFPAAMHCSTSHASDIRLSLHDFPRADAAADHRFFRAWSFLQSASGNKIFPVWVMELL